MKMAPPHRAETGREADNVELWIAELTAAGWTEVRVNVWRRPDGALFRGPYGAWCQLQNPDAYR